MMPHHSGEGAMIGDTGEGEMSRGRWVQEGVNNGNRERGKGTKTREGNKKGWART